MKYETLVYYLSQIHILLLINSLNKHNFSYIYHLLIVLFIIFLPTDVVVEQLGIYPAIKYSLLLFFFVSSSFYVTRSFDYDIFNPDQIFIISRPIQCDSKDFRRPFVSVSSASTWYPLIQTTVLSNGKENNHVRSIHIHLIFTVRGRRCLANLW